MSDPFWIITLGMLVGGPALFYWSKEIVLFQTKISFWLWYRLQPELYERIYGKEKDLGKHPMLKTVGLWNKFMGIGITLMGLFWLVAGLGLLG